MLCVENISNRSGLPYVCLALFECFCVPGGSLEQFKQVLLSGSLHVLKHN